MNQSHTAMPTGSCPSRTRHACKTHSGFRFTTLDLLFLTAGAALLVFAAQKLYGPVFPKHHLERIQSGMSKDEVRSILGTPQKANAIEWTYWHSPNPGWVEIWFDRRGRVSSVNDESAFSSLSGS